MSLRLETLQVARLSSKVLSDSSELVREFILSQFDPVTGAFKDRAGQPDLYYTVFGLAGLQAIQAELPEADVARFLSSLEAEKLDLVHLACLARAWASLSQHPSEASREAIIQAVQSYRSADGGFDQSRESSESNVYAAFMAFGALQDLNAPIPNPEALVQSLQRLRCKDGGYANQAGLPEGLTPTTAAVAALLKQLEADIPAEVSLWLLNRCLPSGGFFATPSAPIPDLLSTATALHALSVLQAESTAIAEPCLDFIDSLWTNRGGFYGHWEDDTLDLEYTWYGLLALGHLSLLTVSS